MRSSLPLLCIIAIARTIAAQDWESADDSLRTTFGVTAPQHARLAAMDSSRAAMLEMARMCDSIAARFDSICALPAPWSATATVATWRGKFQLHTDSLVGAWLAQATVLRDSAFALHMADVQRSAVHVDSVRGVIDLAPLPAQRVYRVRGGDSAVHFVQLDKPRKPGDTIAVCVTLFGRKIFLSRNIATPWEMVEGSTPPVGLDSVFDLVREVPRPRAYDAYDRLAARVAALQARMEGPLAETATALRASLQREQQSNTNGAAYQLQLYNAAARELRWKELMLGAIDAEQRNRPLTAIRALESLRADTAGYDGATELLLRVRHSVDSASHVKYFGADGRTNMVLIPPGDIMLRSGERFRPEPFFIDRFPVSEKLFSLFQSATGYHERGKWRARIVNPESLATEPVRDLAAEDRVAFARWAGKRPASPQEIEFVAAAGFATLAQRRQHATIENPYHAITDDDLFSCVIDLRGIGDAERETLITTAEARAKEIHNAIESVH